MATFGDEPAIEIRPWRRPCFAAINIALVVVTLSGCQVRRPTITLHDIELAGMDLQKVDVIFHLAVTNPNDYQITLRALEYDVSAEGVRIAGGALPGPVSLLPERQTAIIRVPVSLEYDKLAPALSAVVAGGLVPYRIACKATADFFAFQLEIPFTHAGQIPALRRPAWHFRDVRLAENDPTVVELSFDVENPSDLELPLADLSGALMLGDQALLKVERPALNAVPPGKTARVVVPVRLHLAAAANVAKAIASRQSLRFEGRLRLEPPASLRKLLLGTGGA